MIGATELVVQDALQVIAGALANKSSLTPTSIVATSPVAGAVITTRFAPASKCAFALSLVVKKPDAEVSKEELLQFFEGKIAKWWTPDDVTFVDALPHGATGKVLKNKIREQFKDYKLPSA